MRMSIWRRIMRMRMRKRLRSNLQFGFGFELDDNNIIATGLINFDFYYNNFNYYCKK